LCKFTFCRGCVTSLEYAPDIDSITAEVEGNLGNYVIKSWFYKRTEADIERIQRHLQGHLTYTEYPIQEKQIKRKSFMSGKKETPFVLKYSNHVIEHLGVKLYQNKPTNALTELIANGWDADAENVWINLCLDGSQKNWWISVGDDGVGMTRDEVQQDYLVIGRKRRVEVDEKTPQKRRPLMGRKGIGKLAPFGIAKVVDVFTTKEGQVTWISLDLAKMLEQSEDPNQHTTYKP